VAKPWINLLSEIIFSNFIARERSILLLRKSDAGPVIKLIETFFVVLGPLTVYLVVPPLRCKSLKSTSRFTQNRLLPQRYLPPQQHVRRHIKTYGEKKVVQASANPVLASSYGHLALPEDFHSLPRRTLVLNLSKENFDIK
jgi:hypothetical protein